MTHSEKIQKIKDFFDDILSLILPKDADVIELENMPIETLYETIPLADGMEKDNHKALFRYKNSIAQKAIWEIKYHGNKKITEKFSQLLYEFIIEEISDTMLFSNFTHPLVVPIPASARTVKTRGFNQCVLIAQELGKIDRGENFEISYDVLAKIKDTPHQSKLKNRALRLKNLEDSFGADSEKVKGRNIILIDDVITTGATMREASKTLRKAGAKKVMCFAIAH